MKFKSLNCHSRQLAALRRAAACMALFTFHLSFFAFAQPGTKPKPTDMNITSFVDKQNEMLELIKNQLPKMAKHETKLQQNYKSVMSLADQLAYSKNILKIRDSAQTVIVNVVNSTNTLHVELMKLNLEWFKYNKDLMAVYTRYGELKIVNNIDENLKKFLVEYRLWLDTMEKLLKLVTDIKNESDFLLNSKLN